MTLLKLDASSDEDLQRTERRLKAILVHPLRLPHCDHLTLLDAMLEIAGALYLVRLELGKRHKEAA